MPVEFSFTASGEEGFTFSASGTITATLVTSDYTGNGSTQSEYTVDSISGNVNGENISGLEAAGAHGGYGDNLVFSPDPFLDNSGVNFTTDNGDHYNLSFFATFDQQEIYYTGVDDSSGQSIESADGPIDFTMSPVCFLRGTAIRTVRGETPVERLAIGDLVVTSSGRSRPVRWVGHRVVDLRRHPRPREMYPIRIAAHAFGPDRPSRDLFVSPGHSICVDVVGEVLINACGLVNGSTISQVEVDEVSYWHVELDSHDIILAENLPTESYLDCGNRRFFCEADAVDLHPSAEATSVDRARFCRPFHGAGPLVDVVRSQLVRRAETLGWRLEDHPFANMHLVADDVRLEPVIRGLCARFTLPAGAKEVWLVSDAVRPIDVGGGSDRRLLGVCVRSFSVDDGFDAARVIPVDEPSLNKGFSGVESDGDGKWRWTTGRARLPASLWADQVDGFVFCVNLRGPALRQWKNPRGERWDRAATAETA